MTNLPPPRSEHDHIEDSDPAAAGWYGLPHVPERYVRRSRLFELMDRTDEVPLMLVSAAAGAGKTSMVADWVASRDDAAATQWVTFEPGEERFWPGVVGGLARLGVDVPAGCDPDGAVPVERRELTALAAAVAGRPGRLTLVLDGYELVSPEIAGDLDFLMRHTGRRLGLVLVTRVDPVLPLYRYRLEETVAEVRMADLAFTDEEAADLMRAAGVDLTGEAVRALNARTEGWVAGLKFASVFLAEKPDPDDAVSEVAGDTGNIASYLMGEVLAVQSPETRTLLLRTSVPDVIQPGLAETLAGRSATRTLASLSRKNTFVEPVPEHPGFYRYHPFFRDLLRAELAFEAPAEMRAVHRLAAEWLAEDGQLTAAINHFVDIGAWGEAAGQVVDDLAVAELLVGGGDAPLARGLRSIPAHVAGDAASIVRATLALADNDTDRCSEELATVTDDGAEHPDDRARAVAVAVAVLRSVRARTVSATAVAAELADEAHEVVTSHREDRRVAQHPELSALIQVSRGMASLRRGRLSEAETFFDLGAAQASPATRGLLSLRVECLGYLALIAALGDRLQHARSLAARAVALADEAGLTPAERPPGAQLALALVAIEQCHMLDAHEHARLAQVSAYSFGEPVTSALLALVRARLDGATRNAPRALATVEAAVADLVDPSEWLAIILRIEAARLKIATRRPAAALAAVEGLSIEQPAAVATVVAQVRLAEGDVGAARAALAPALDVTAPVRDRVAGLLLEATCQLRRGRSGSAGAALDRALRLATKERLRRPFREAHADIAPMLAASSGPGVGWLQMPASRARPAVPAQRVLPPAGLRSSPESAPIVVDHLTDKELQVLGLLAELLSTEEIADALFVSVNTIRTHVRSILRKLGVSRRNAAVRRARELQLL